MGILIFFIGFLIGLVTEFFLLAIIFAVIDKPDREAQEKASAEWIREQEAEGKDNG